MTSGFHFSKGGSFPGPKSSNHAWVLSELPKVLRAKINEQGKEKLYGDKVGQRPRCGAEGSLYQRAEFDQLPWLAALLLALIGQSTEQDTHLMSPVGAA